MTKLWLHVGPPKTGTTTIQLFLYANRKTLAERGVTYPRVPPNAHHKAAYAHHFLPFAARGQDTGCVRDFLYGLPRDAGDIILSSERFGSFGDGLPDALRDFDVRVIFYARDPVEGAASMAQQLIKAGSRTYEQTSAKPPIPVLRAWIERWRRAFGADHVIVRKFARTSFKDGDLISDFFDAIGHPDAPEGMPRRSRNESLSLEAAQRISAYRSETGNTDRIRLGDHRFFKAGEETRFHLPGAAVAKVRRKTANDLRWLHEVYGISFDEHEPTR